MSPYGIDDLSRVSRLFDFNTMIAVSDELHVSNGVGGSATTEESDAEGDSARLDLTSTSAGTADVMVTTRKLWRPDRNGSMRVVGRFKKTAKAGLWFGCTSASNPGSGALPYTEESGVKATPATSSVGLLWDETTASGNPQADHFKAVGSRDGSDLVPFECKLRQYPNLENGVTYVLAVEANEEGTAYFYIGEAGDFDGGDYMGKIENAFEVDAVYAFGFGQGARNVAAKSYWDYLFYSFDRYRG